MDAVISDRILTGDDIQNNLDEIQGNIIKPYTFGLQRGLFFKIEDEHAGRAWLAALSYHVTPATVWPEGERPVCALNIGISVFGLRSLGLSDSALAGFAPEFQAGAVGRADRLGDVDELSPTTWQDGFGGEDIHVAVFVFADEQSDLDAHAEKVRKAARSLGGIVEMAAHDGYAFEDGVEHFGYRDGLTDVPIEGTENIYPQNLGGGTRRPDGTWAPLKPGEFLLGYENESRTEPPIPQPRELGLNGTFIVYRKIYQDVAAFRQFLAQAAECVYGSDSDDDQERMAAKFMGRWRSGCPLMHSPETDQPELADDPVKCNDFGYTDDPDGMICPRGSHIRRMNPRDALDGTATVVRRHRLIRRGLDYGPKLPDGQMEDDGQDRGIASYLVCANLKDQFEFIWQEWVNKGDFAGLPIGEQDPIIGPASADAQMTLPGEPMPFLFDFKRFITTRCGEYFFMPSLTALRGIAAKKY